MVKPNIKYRVTLSGEERELLQKLVQKGKTAGYRIRHTPKHGSRLNMAELEIGVMSRQCLGRRIATMEQMAGEVRA